MSSVLLRLEMRANAFNKSKTPFCALRRPTNRMPERAEFDAGGINTDVSTGIGPTTTFVLGENCMAVFASQRETAVTTRARCNTGCINFCATGIPRAKRTSEPCIVITSGSDND